MVFLILDIIKMVKKRERVFVTHFFDSSGRIHFVEREIIPPKANKGFINRQLTKLDVISSRLKKCGHQTEFEPNKDES